jgi:hypothetical protein
LVTINTGLGKKNSGPVFMLQLKRDDFKKKFTNLHLLPIFIILAASTAIHPKITQCLSQHILPLQIVCIGNFAQFKDISCGNEFCTEKIKYNVNLFD